MPRVTDSDDDMAESYPSASHLPWGLCGQCANARPIENDRGTRFVMCRLSGTGAAFPRYPALPVRACPGFEDKATGACPGQGAT